jgi:hypothetical protein
MAEMIECVDCGKEMPEDTLHLCRARTCDGCGIEFHYILPMTDTMIEDENGEHVERLCPECKK